MRSPRRAPTIRDTEVIQTSMSAEDRAEGTRTSEATALWAGPESRRSLLMICVAWLVLQIGGLFSPGLLDDVDSIYIEVAREMLHRHDFVTPYVDGIRFFDKPPLMYWMASGSMAVLGEYDWAARLPMALATLGLFVAVYALGSRFYGERAGLYAALAMATSVGPYLYTRFFIPDLLICLWMAVGVHLLLVAVDRLRCGQSALWPCLGFGAVLGLNLLTKGLIGLVFPLGLAFLFLCFSGDLRRIRQLHPVESLTAFAAVALPWHVLAAWRNPAIVLPAGLSLPARGGWGWFYLYNEHVARFLGQRIPHDYGNTPVWLFWLYAAIWIFPWTVFLPGAVGEMWRHLGHLHPVTRRQREAALTLALWAGLVLGFFSISSRQEYYSLPAIPALALMVGGLLAGAESNGERGARIRLASLRWTAWLLLPLTIGVGLVCGFLAISAPRPPAGTDLSALLVVNPDLYNLSLGHLFDLTGPAMGLFRGPLEGVAAGMFVLGLGSYLLRRAGRSYAANLTMAASMLVILSCAHEGLRRFYPILGSKELAQAIERVRRPGDLIILDGEFTAGSSLVFYTGQPVHLLGGRVNTLWYGSFWPDAPAVFEKEASLRALWMGSTRVFLMTYDAPPRARLLAAFGPVVRVASAGGKTVLSNR